MNHNIHNNQSEKAKLIVVGSSTQKEGRSERDTTTVTTVIRQYNPSSHITSQQPDVK